VGYDSPLRWWRSSRFLAEKGMGITIGVGLEVQERLSLLAPGGESPCFITVERHFYRCHPLSEPAESLDPLHYPFPC